MSEFNLKDIKCDNCGFDFSINKGGIVEVAEIEAIYTCPVCSFSDAATATSAEIGQDQLSIGDLESQLKTLLAKARTAGIPSNEIVVILRAELEFEAEMAQAGRRILVQIIDLGFQEAAHSATAPYHSGREHFENQAGL